MENEKKMKKLLSLMMAAVFLCLAASGCASRADLNECNVDEGLFEPLLCQILQSRGVTEKPKIVEVRSSTDEGGSYGPSVNVEIYFRVAGRLFVAEAVNNERKEIQRIRDTNGFPQTYWFNGVHYGKSYELDFKTGEIDTSPWIDEKIYALLEQYKHRDALQFGEQWSVDGCYLEIEVDHLAIPEIYELGEYLCRACEGDCAYEDIAISYHPTPGYGFTLWMENTGDSFATQVIPVSMDRLTAQDTDYLTGDYWSSPYFKAHDVNAATRESDMPREEAE